MAQMTSGKVLREAREMKGYDLNTVARRLRIRPDILRAIEAGDFSTMPPRGYTRNMVNAYARLLGLNPTEIVNMYLDEAYAEQVEQARGKGPSSGFNLQRENRRSRSRVGVGDASSDTRMLPKLDEDIPNGGTRQFTRVLYDDSTRFARDDYGVTRERAERPGKSERDFSSHHSGYEATNFNFLDNRGATRGTRSIYAGQTPMQYSASRLPGFLQSKPVVIGIIAVVVIIVIIVLVVVLGGNKAPQEDVSQLPVSGITDTTGTSSASASSSAAAAPTSARVVYSVKSGSTCYAEIYLDGQMSAEEIAGPAEKTVDVTGIWTFTTWDPDSVTLTVDGTKVQLKTSTEYNGMYAYTVDFPAMLAQWKKTGSTTLSSSTSASASTQSATAAAAAGTAAAATAAAGAAAADAATGSNVTAQSTDEATDESQTTDENTEDAYTEDGTENQEYEEVPAEGTETYDESGQVTETTEDQGAYEGEATEDQAQ